jgi:plastocyanin
MFSGGVKMKISSRYFLPLILFVLVSFISACSGTTSSTSTTSIFTTTSTTSTSTSPSVEITSPGAGTIPQIGSVTISVSVSNFKIVDKLGQANVPGEGHLHYFMDVDAPTSPGKVAVTAAGTYAATTATSYTWTNVGGGPHKFSVELANNDHTPLNPPVVAAVNNFVLPEIGPPVMVILTPRDGANVPAENLTVSVQVANFNLVDKQGHANVPREGHLHYFLDVEAPTAPGKPAIPAGGVWAHVPDTGYSFGAVTPGPHTISVELINNDHTPLDPPVVAKVTVKAVASSIPTTTSTPAPSTTSPTTSTPPASSTTTSPAGQAVNISLTAKSMLFDKSTITVPAGAVVTINFTNSDIGIPHNFALFASAGAVPPALFQGAIITGPATANYTFTAPVAPGNYFFRCDIHPTTMTGTLVVMPAS